MPLEIDAEEYKKIEDLIAMADSPVGIDAKKTHVIILHTLLKIEERLSRLEDKLG
jgi:hypothetical protein